MSRFIATNRTSKQVAAKPQVVPATLGFGVPDTPDPHHFRVSIPRSSSGLVGISEFLGTQPSLAAPDVIDRAVLPYRHWGAICVAVQLTFNASLKQHGLKSGAWKLGENLVDRLLGKELCVLAWAVEKVELSCVPLALRNWLDLRAEERWWLFGMTARSAGGLNQGDRGWRMALRYALGDTGTADGPQGPLAAEGPEKQAPGAIFTPQSAPPRPSKGGRRRGGDHGPPKLLDLLVDDSA